MRRARIVALAWIPVPVLFTLWTVAPAPDPVPGVEIERVGYFKDDDRFRVMAYRADAPLTRAQAEVALKGVMHSDGAMTWAVIYGPGGRDPGHALSALARRADALGMINAPPFDGWDWHLSIRHDGLRTLTGH